MSDGYKKIMVTVDGSPFAAEALPHAERQAKAFGAELILFRVVKDSSVVLPNQGLYPTRIVQDIGEEVAGIEYGTRQEKGRQIDFAQQALEHLAVDLRRQGIEVSCVVDAGSPAECIVDYIKTNNIDLLVLSTHSRAGFARAMFGSVAQEVLRESACPMLLVRPES